MTSHSQMWIDRTRNALAFFLIGSFVGAVVYMIGQLSGMATLALGYYFTKGAGQDSLDAARTATTGKLADAVTAVASSGAPLAAPDPAPPGE